MSSSVAANREAIRNDIDTARVILDRHAVLVGEAYKELSMLAIITMNAVEFLSRPMKGQYDDIGVYRELRKAILKAEQAVAGARAA